MWAPEAFQPNILIIAGGNYRTGRCTDGRKVKVLAWLGTWQFFLPIHGGQIVDQAMFFFVFCGNTWLFDVIWITQRRKVPYIWCHFDAFQCGDVKQLNGAPSSAGLRSMPCPPNAFGFAWSWGRPIEGWRDRRKQISGWWGLIQVPIFRSQFFLSTKTHAIYYCWWQPENPKGPTTVFLDGAQTLGKSMGINQRSSPQGDDGALLASVCDEGVRVYDADHRYKVVQELEKVWRQKEMMGWWLRFRQIFREMFRYIIIYVCIYIYVFAF